MNEDRPSEQTKGEDVKTAARSKPARALQLNQFKERQKLPDVSLLSGPENGLNHLPPNAAELGDFYHL